MRYALLLSTILVLPGAAFANGSHSSSSTPSTTTSTSSTASTPSTSTTSSTEPSSQVTPQTNLSSAPGTTQADSWGSFQAGGIDYAATVVDPPGNNNSPYEILLATHEGKTTPYIFELTPGGNGTLPPMANNDLPATPAGGTGSGSGSGSGSTTGGTDVSTGGVGNNNNIIRIGGKDYQVVPVDSGSGTGSGTGSGSGTQTPQTITQLKDELVKAQRETAKLTDQLVTQINNQLPTTDPVPASGGSTTTSSSSGTQTAAR